MSGGSPIELHWVQRRGSRPGDLHRPDSLLEAARLLADHPDIVPIAGGTDLLLELARDGHGATRPLLDLTGIDASRSIDGADPAHIRLGGGTTHADVVASSVVVERALPLAQACLELGSPQLRNRATVAGNLVTASPANDTISTLMAMGARVSSVRWVNGALVSSETTLDEFYPGFRQTVLRPGELVEAILVPPLRAGRRGVWVKVGLRKAQAISVVHAGFVIEEADDGTVTAARIALGSVAPTVVLSPDAQRVLVGASLSPSVIADAADAATDAVSPIDDGRATADYRRDAVHTVVSRALTTLAQRREAERWPARVPLLSSRGRAGPDRDRRTTLLAATSEIEMQVNGATVGGVATGMGTLLDWLRDHVGTGTKEGCAEGECGACTVHLDREAVMSCLVPAAQADGGTVVTVEGLATDAGPHPLQQSFVDRFAVQCGYCIPGFVMAAAALADELADPSRTEIEFALSGNLCRCTGYYNIIDAVRKSAREGRRGMSMASSPPRFDAPAKTDGSAGYPGDRHAPNALVAKVVFTGQAHARLVSLDTTEAESIDGVVAVLTAADVPVNEYGLTKFDQPVLVGPDDAPNVAVATNVSRWEADHLAVVIAETAEIADRAAAALRVEWQQLELVVDIDQALDDRVLVHPQDGTNSYAHLKIRRGDVDAAFAAAAVVVDNTYRLPHQEHAYLQPEAATSWIDEHDRVTVEVAGQWTHEDQEQIAHALDLAPERVRVVYPAIGGAFGGREDMSLQIVMALAAQRVASLGIDRPVHCRWSREESVVGHHKRHRALIRSRLGADENGVITAVEARVLLDAGAYNYTSNKVLGNAHLCVAGPYVVPNAKIDSIAVYTTSPPGGAFRGFGGPQGAFVAETQMNRLAEALGIDPVELRRRNQVHEGSAGITGAILPAGVSLPEVIDACAERFDFAAPLGAGEPFSPFVSLPPDPATVRRGRGSASGYKNVGFSFGFPERCEAEIHLQGGRDDTDPTGVDLFHAGAEVGQGSHQAFLQMAAKATGVDLEQVSGHFSDTADTGDSGSASASRLTFMAGNSIVAAAEAAAKAWADGDRPAIGHARYVPPETELLDPDTGAGQPNFCYGYMAQAVELTVDTATGHIRVDRVVSAHDVGRTINAELLRGQVEGAVVQAHGYVLSENLQVADGMIRNPRFSTYLIPGIGDVPGRVETVILELADPLGPFGARGVAEMPYLTYAPAVVAALHDATGVWFDEFPLTPSRVLAGLKAARR